MSARGVRALVWRDLTVVRRSGPLLAPIIVLPVIVAGILPGLVAILPRLLGDSADAGVTTTKLLERLPMALRQELAGLSNDQAMVVLVIGYFLAPVFLILPFFVSNAIAADGFAGERERKTLEALLYSPLSDGELFFAKTMVAWIPSLLVTLGSFVLYSIAANAAAWPIMGRVFFPNVMWLVLVFWVAPAVAALGLAAMVLVSARVRGVQESMQLSGLLVLPFVVLIVNQARGTMILGTRVTALLGLGCWLVSGALLWYGAKTFRRQKLISRI